MIQNFTGYSRYYDLLYAEKNYKQEVSYIDKHIKELSPHASSLLELGSGTGNHAKHFAQLGYSITGVERSIEMANISLAKQIPGFKPVIGDMASFSVNDKFDVAIALFHSVCYLSTNEALLQCFSSVYQHLKPTGLFCFDFWYGPGVLHDLPTTRVKRVNSDGLEILRIAETEMLSDQNIAVVNYDVTITEEATGKVERIKEQHPMRYLSIPELDLICNQTGFKLLRSETFLDGAKPDLTSWNVFSIAQRID